MTYNSDLNFVVRGVLATAVANSGTFTVSYPSGASQNLFGVGLAGPNSHLILNGNDKYMNAAGGISLSFGASLITVTNLSGATIPAGTPFILNLDVRDGDDVEFLTLPLPLLAAIANGDVVTEIQPGVNGTIESVEFVTTAPVTTASRAATLNLEIDTTNVTGGEVALTSAAVTPLGRVIQGAAITANNVLTKASKLSVEASSVTAFAEGSGYLLIRIRKAV